MSSKYDIMLRKMRESDAGVAPYYATLTLLQAVVGVEGDFAVVEDTDTLWLWDADTSAWKQVGGSATADLGDIPASSGNWNSAYTTVRDNSGSWAPIGEWTLVERKFFSSPSGSYLFPGLDGNTDMRYRIKLFCVDGNSVAGAVTIQPNTDTSSSNYLSMQLQGDGTNPTSAKQTSDGYYIGYAYGTGGFLISDCEIYAISGVNRKMLASAYMNDVETSSGARLVLASSWKNSADNITALNVTGAQANTFGIGSYIELWKLAQ